jgi:multidrug efflux pump subunit AcrB
MGYTINRVSLFALIFSIGILVDDAIVVVENIVRHWRARGAQDLVTSAVEAVAEVGNPTIVATLTIVVALLPMMFVSGLMGPYMSPIPANASTAMLFSFLVAVIIAPWLLYHISRRRFDRGFVAGVERADVGAIGRIYLKIAQPLLAGRRPSQLFLLAVAAATAGVCALFVTKDVTVKLLPFDNKSELQVVVDLPQGATVEDTERLLSAAAQRLDDLPELTSVQLYAGVAAPFNFNGLVRHYYLRRSAEQGDLQVNLIGKGSRSRSSHAIALDVRQRLSALPRPAGTVLRVAEVPPGPPVLATLLAEVYGPDEETRRAAAKRAPQSIGC